jgi:RNA polymerase sigma factor (sigma-70 family)
MVTTVAAREAIDPEQRVGFLPDEELVILVQKFGHKPARDELLTRSSRQRETLVHRLARDTRLSETDRADALQEAVLWTIEAIRQYHATAAGCSFRSFLHRVISCRFIDYLRHRVRYHRHIVLIGGTRPTDLDKFFAPARLSGTHPEVDRQDGGVEEKESSDRLQQQLDRLCVGTRRLWELLARGASVVEISAVLQISYDTAKRRRRKLIVQLRRSLNVEQTDSE